MENALKENKLNQRSMSTLKRRRTMLNDKITNQTHKDRSKIFLIYYTNVEKMMKLKK